MRILRRATPRGARSATDRRNSPPPSRIAISPEAWRHERRREIADVEQLEGWIADRCRAAAERAHQAGRTLSIGPVRLERLRWNDFWRCDGLAGPGWYGRLTLHCTGSLPSLSDVLEGTLVRPGTAYRFGDVIVAPVTLFAGDFPALARPSGSPSLREQSECDVVHHARH